MFFSNFRTIKGNQPCFVFKRTPCIHSKNNFHSNILKSSVETYMSAVIVEGKKIQVECLNIWKVWFLDSFWLIWWHFLVLRIFSNNMISLGTTVIMSLKPLRCDVHITTPLLKYYFECEKLLACHGCWFSLIFIMTVQELSFSERWKSKRRYL